MQQKIQDIFDLLRVKQWVKNTFIFFPILFSGRLFQTGTFIDSLMTFGGFCLVSSGLYILNDYRDRKKDRLHPKKAQRPLSRHEVKLLNIIVLIGAITLAGLWITCLVSVQVFILALVYIILHLSYNFFTKSIVILDVVSVAAGFQIRILAGSAAAMVAPSIWLQMCVFILALFLGFTKRRYEISTLKAQAAEHRDVLSHYNEYLLDQIIIICSTLAIVFYGLYTISSDIEHRLGNQSMLYSIVFVIYGIFRYLYLVHVKKLGDEPGEMLATDAPLLLNVIAWIVYVGFLIYSV